MANLVGARIERKEDKKFLTGKGRYTADINLPQQTYAYFVRSPHARAKITKIDLSKAEKSPGVVKILTGENLAKDLETLQDKLPEFKKNEAALILKKGLGENVYNNIFIHIWIFVNRIRIATHN